jgi:hypothetical protein
VRIHSHLSFLLFFATVYIGAIDLSVGVAYLFAIIPLITVLNIPSLRNRMVFPLVFFSSLSFFIFYLVRPLFLINNYEHFTYAQILEVGNENIIEALYQIGLFEITYFLGLYLVWSFFTRRLKILADRNLEITINPLMYRAKNLIIISSLLIYIFYLLIVNFLDEQSLNYFRLILPLGLVLPIAIYYIVLFSDSVCIKKHQKYTLYFIILLIIFIAIVGGHKAALFNVLLYVLIGYVLYFGNYKIKSIDFALIILILITSLSIFIYAREFKVLIEFYGFNANFLFSFVDYIQEFNARENVLNTSIDRFTKRLAGFDGLLVVNYYQPHEIKEIYTSSNIVFNILSKILPYVELNSLSLGKGVSNYYTLLPEEHNHSGALGALAAFKLIDFNFAKGYFFIFLFSILFSTLYFKSIKISSNSIAYSVISFIILNKIITIFVSGNLDNNISGFIITMIHLFVLYFIFRAAFNVRDKPKF